MFKFTSPVSAPLQDNTSSSLATVAGVLGNTVFDNTPAANGDFFGLAELICAFSVAPAANATVDLYLLPSTDGTNYPDAVAGQPPAMLFAGSFVLQAITTSQRLQIANVPLGPFKYKAFVKNSTLQTMSAGWTLTLFAYAEQ